MRIAGEKIGFRIGPHVLLDGVTLDVPDGSMVGLVGANGSGKSTLLRLLYRALKPQTGTAWLGDMPLWELDQRRAAQLIGAVPQDQPSEFDLTVNDLVQLGRLPHQHMFARTSMKDEQIVADALEQTGVTHLRHRSLKALSGGERQRAIVARALAQQPQVLLLDEPTNSLDVRYQHELLQLLRDLRLTSLIALHDLNLAGAYCDYAIVLRSGSVVAAGPVLDVLVPEVIEPAFGIGASLIEHPVSGRRQLVFHPLSKERHEKNNGQIYQETYLRKPT